MPISIFNKESIKYDTIVTMITVKCCKCGVPFAMPESLRESFQKTKDFFFCPNGHSQHYSRSTADLLREKLEKEQAEREQEKKRLESDSSFWQDCWSKAMAREKKANAKLRKTTQRVHNGVCPCCNRTFKNLASHMMNKHPQETNRINKERKQGK